LPANRLPGTFNPTAQAWQQVPLLDWDQVLEWPNAATLGKPTQSVSSDMPLSEKAYALAVKDTTMEPRFPENTIIIVDPAIQPTNRDFAVVHLEGQKHPTFKQILIDGDTAYIKPLNPDFKAQLLDKKYKFLGVVVQARMDFK
jgi:SOS-response transcriptional repressor LexA